MSFIYIEEDEPVRIDKPPDFVLTTLRSWNTSKTRPRGWFLNVSGETQSGKSTMAAHIAEKIDPRFTASLKNHPVFTGDPRTAVDCHLSVRLAPFLMAVKQHKLPWGSVWILDEPDDIDSKEWYTKSAKAIRIIVGEFMDEGIDLILLSRVREEALGDLRRLAHFWINVDAPGFGNFYRNRDHINMKSVKRSMVRRPWLKSKIEEAPKASDEFHELYREIKRANKDKMISRAVDDALKTEKELGIV